MISEFLGGRYQMICVLQSGLASGGSPSEAIMYTLGAREWFGSLANANFEDLDNES